MANKKYDDSEGVWRTIGGRRVFIRTGQSLSDAMKESGKFSRVAKNQELYKKLDEEKKKDEYESKVYGSDVRKADGEMKKVFGDDFKYAEDLEKSNWRDEVKKNNDQLNKETEDLQKKINELRSKSYQGDGVEKYRAWQEAEKLQEQYYEKFRENERKNAKLKKEEPNEPYEFVEAYAGYRDKSYKLAGTKEQNGEVVEYGDKSWSGKEYTNDEFMEHLEDSNWHSERKQLLDANLTNQELSYIKDHTTLSQWSVGEELTGKENTQKLIDEAKNHFNKNNEKHAGWELYSDDPHRYDDTIKSAQARKEKFTADSEFKKSHHIGFGEYNKDGVPVYNNDIDYKGDFGFAKLDNLTNDDLTKALNVQSEEYHKASDEKVGDRRTRNGRMDEIFKNAKVGKYEQGMKKINEEMEKRDMPRYNIYNESGVLLVSSPTKEMADKQIQDMIRSDISLQKEYNWEKLPKYTTKVEKKKETEEGFAGANQITNSIQRKAYQKYMKEHPNSKKTFEEFKNMKK